MIVTTTNRWQPPTGRVLHVAGELDTFAADRLRAHLRPLGGAASGAVVVDLSGVNFMSCTALRVLAEARSRLGARFFVTGRSRVVVRLLEVTGLSAFFADLPDDDPSVERARQLLVAVHGCTSEQAAAMLARAAEDYGVPLHELAHVLGREPRAADRPPSAEAAVATLALLMRPLSEDLAADGAPHARVAAGGPARVFEVLTP